MKNLIKALSFAAIVGIFAASCDDELCEGVIAGSNGKCSEGIVTCNPGWEKDAAGACNTGIDAKFIGVWTATDDCIEDGLLDHTVVITANATRKIKIDIMGLHNLTTTIFVCDLDLVDGTKFTIPMTTVDNRSFSGSGTITSGNKIVVNYTVDGIDCVATLTK